MDDREAMQQAIACARSVEARTSPRPPVGAIVVRDGEIVGRGATAPPYGPHAEIQALAQAGAAANGAHLYVTLEPCCIHVHTPPCTEAIIAAGVQRVVIGTQDPNPCVRTRGIEQLRTAGIETSLLEKNTQEAREATELIYPFETYITKGRPYVTAKWAMTLDGKLASYTGDSYWISGPDARIWVHDLRDRVDAVLVGANTARVDNPRLTVRIPPEKRLWKRTPRLQAPLRVVLATSGQLPASLSLLQPELARGTCILVGETSPREQRQRLADYGTDIIPVAIGEDGQIDLQSALQALAQRGIMHVLIEGGAKVLGSAFDQRCIDHVAAFIAPKLIGGSDALSPIEGRGLPMMAHAHQLQNVRTSIFDGDVLIEGDVLYLNGSSYKQACINER
jgi:diaminohydroxyphosphoribosylaminopyrimidine deaminase / 5-amino-6-(5-phosphoribosylamino)uracil reductase